MIEIAPKDVPRDLRIAIVASRFNAFIVEQLLVGARDALERSGIATDRQVLVWVSGAFELPLAADRLAASGQYDAVVALGAVVRGGTDFPAFTRTAASFAQAINAFS